MFGHPSVLFAQVFGRFFPDDAVDGPGGLPALGAEIFAVVQRRVRRRGLDPDHARDAFQQFLIAALVFLERHGPQKVRQLRPWAHRVAKSSTSRLLTKLVGPVKAPYPLVWLEDLLDGDGELNLKDLPQLDLAVHDTARIFRAALATLSLRHREYLRLRFERGASPAEIMASMEIPTRSSLGHLRTAATHAVRAAVKAQIAAVHVET